MKDNEQFIMPLEREKRTKKHIFKTGLACLAMAACIISVQNLIPLDVYANPGINEYTNFVVAHGCGSMKVDGKTKKYINAVECVEHHYEQGTRLFEIDFVFSKEHELIATHKYEYLKGYGKNNKIPFEEYENTKILGKYHGMTSERLFELIKKYPDAKFIIDTKESDQFEVYSKLIDDANEAGVDISKNVLPFVFSKEMLEKLEQKYNFEEYMLTNYRAHYSTDELVKIIEGNEKIKYVHMFVTDFAVIDINTLNKQGIRVFAHMDDNAIINVLNYGCTGIFSDDLTEKTFDLKYKHIFDAKLEEQEPDAAALDLAQEYGLTM